MADPRRNRKFRDAVRGRSVESVEKAGTDDSLVPPALAVTTAFAWRLLVIGIAIACAIFLIIQLKMLVIPMMIALLITALLWPFFTFMLRRGMPRWIALILSLAGTVAVIWGLMTLAVTQIVSEFPKVETKTMEGVTQLQHWVADGPLHISAAQFQEWIDKGTAMLSEQAQTLFRGVLAVGSTLGHVATGAVLSMFILLCLLADGEGIWRWTLKLFPRKAREATDASARLGWKTVVNYARTQLLVACINAVGIGAVAFFLGVPMPIAVAVLVFLGSFIPIVGAVLTGAFAVFLALVYNGPIIALWMLIGVLAVQQIEGHVLHPLLMGAAVKVHPLAVVLVVAGGAMIAGIPGALFAVPLAAFVNVVGVSLAGGAWRKGETGITKDLIWQTVPRERRAR